jgi:hypothetical protein
LGRCSSNQQNQAQKHKGHRDWFVVRGWLVSGFCVFAESGHTQLQTPNIDAHEFRGG